MFVQEGLSARHEHIRQHLHVHVVLEQFTDVETLFKGPLMHLLKPYGTVFPLAKFGTAQRVPEGGLELSNRLDCLFDNLHISRVESLGFF